ncbi:MAG TPA: TlpA disulfide reductase family protein [Fimbriimonadaceae bacterium]|nr:TlpA disulfide reductase family protein [Fimbriimonadaceae bacterium]
MKFSNVVWAFVFIIAIVALLRYRPVQDAGAETANLLSPESGMRTRIVNYPLVDAETGKSVKLADFQGKAKAIYIDVFASWCGPCQSLLPDVKELHERMKNRGVLVLGLNVFDEWDAMKRDVHENGLPYPVLYDDGKAGGIGNLLQANTIPTVIVLDGKTLEQKARWIGGDNAGERDRIFRELGVDL